MKTFNRIVLVLSIALLIYIIVINMIFGSIAFSKTLALFCIIGIIYGIIQLHYQDRWLMFFPKTIRYIIYISLTVILSLFILVEGIIIYDALHKDDIQCEKVIVLGAGLKGDTITSSLKYRLDTAMTYYQTYPQTTIIVSGGQGEGENTTEAFAMKNYLIAHGIPDEKIIEEDQSTSTYENFKFSLQYIEPQDKVMIITNSFHLSRSKLIAKRLNIQAYGYAAPSHLPTLINFYLREFFAYIKDFIFTR